MAVDTPATIAVIGAGPIGLEAALYARFLGYDVRVYERGRVAENLLSQGNQSGDATWISYTSPLGIAAIAAQRPDWQPPATDAVLSAQELTELYFLPLAQSDLLVDSMQVDTEVLAVERDPASDGTAADEDDVPGFLLRVRDAAGERVEEADVVIDASGAGSLPPAGSSLYATLALSGSAVQPAESGKNDDPARLVTAEPDLYILGAKSAAAPAEFRIRDGLAQIRDLFTIIADRATLNLYGTVAAR
jgi:threonine dehydrogenase-like Zn-dependent dehydrogenase